MYILLCTVCCDGNSEPTRAGCWWLVGEGSIRHEQQIIQPCTPCLSVEKIRAGGDGVELDLAANLVTV